MPYTDIKFIKLFLRLFDEDDRFLFQINERQQLLYIKMLYLAGKCKNKIPKNPRFVISKINYRHDESTLTEDLTVLMDTFKKFTQGKLYYRFRDFHELHNWYSKSTPKELQRSAKSSSQNKNKKKNKNKRKKKKNTKKKKKVPYAEYVELWNKLTDHHQIRTPISKKRKKHLCVRHGEKLFRESYKEILTKISASDFLTGKNPSKSHPNFKATFDWVIKNDHNYQKILEGNYDNVKKKRIL